MINHTHTHIHTHTHTHAYRQTDTPVVFPLLSLEVKLVEPQAPERVIKSCRSGSLRITKRVLLLRGYDVIANFYKYATESLAWCPGPGYQATRSCSH